MPAVDVEREDKGVWVARALAVPDHIEVFVRGLNPGSDERPKPVAAVKQPLLSSGFVLGYVLPEDDPVKQALLPNVLDQAVKLLALHQWAIGGWVDREIVAPGFRHDQEPPFCGHFFAVWRRESALGLPQPAHSIRKPWRPMRRSYQRGLLLPA